MSAKIYHFPTENRSPNHSPTPDIQWTIANHLSSEFVTFPSFAGLDESINLLGSSKVERSQLTFHIHVDNEAYQNQKCFFESTTRDRLPRLGWVFRCKADVVLLFLPQSGRLFWIYTSTLQSAVAHWYRQYSASGDRVNGVLVPIAEVVKISWRSDFVSVSSVSPSENEKADRSNRQ